MSENKGIHDGHRNRVREKFLSDGFDGFCEHQILELLLFYAVPRKDTNELAHNLINNCGSLSAVFDASIEILEECGLSKNAAVLLKMIPPLCQKYMDDKYKNENKIITEENIGERILLNFINADEEKVVLLLLNAKGTELYCGTVSKGSVNASEIYTRKIIQLAMKFHASGAVIAHNHPSGIALPSKNDITSTISLRKALSTISVRLLDHIIVADMEYMSLAQDENYMEIFL